jgi:hypothetical protein
MNETKKDNLACGAVLATMLVTIACGAFVVGFSPDSPRHARATTETEYD